MEGKGRWGWEGKDRDRGVRRGDRREQEGRGGKGGDID